MTSDRKREAERSFIQSFTFLRTLQDGVKKRLFFWTMNCSEEFPSECEKPGVQTELKKGMSIFIDVSIKNTYILYYIYSYIYIYDKIRIPIIYYKKTAYIVFFSVFVATLKQSNNKTDECWFGCG